MGDLPDEFHGYLDHTAFGSSRDALGGNVASLGWLVGAVALTLGVLAGESGWPLVAAGTGVLLLMVVRSIRRRRDRRRDHLLAQRAPIELPDHPQPQHDVHLHLDVPDHGDPDPR